MKTEIKYIPLKELFKGYSNDDENGAYAYDGKLDVRPKYQREFVYKEEQQKNVIDTILMGAPLGLLYWPIIGDKYECLDGQQRCISICEFLEGNFHIEFQGHEQTFNNLPVEVQERILNYEILVAFLEGTREEYKMWFDRINTAGAVMTEQEKRNGAYCCPALEKLKKFLSKRNSPYVSHCQPYMNGEAIRQDYLETTLLWYSCNFETKQQDYNKNIEKCMLDLISNPEKANEIISFIKDVITWVENTFTTYRKEMKGLPWGFLYKLCKDNVYNPGEMEEKVHNLMVDDEITANKGIYMYLLIGDTKYLNQREFDYSIRRKVYEQQNGICPDCGDHYEFEEMEGHHIVPWVSGGKTVIENCQMLCKKCHSKKNA